MSTRHEIYTFIHQELKKKLQQQFSIGQSKDLCTLLDKLYSLPQEQLKSIEPRLVNQFGDRPQLMHETLCLLKACQFVSALAEKEHFREIAEDLFEIVQMLHSRNDVMMDSIYMKLESAIFNDMQNITEIHEVLYWLEFFEKFLEHFGYKATSAITHLENKFCVIVHEELQKEEIEIIGLLGVVNELSGKEGFDLKGLLSVTIDKALTIISELERGGKEMYWKISDILRAINKCPVPEEIVKSVNFYTRKYEESIKDCDGVKIDIRNNKRLVKGLYQINPGRVMFTRSNSDQNFSFTKKYGTLNTTFAEPAVLDQHGNNINNKKPAVIYQYAIKTKNKKIFDTEKARLIKLGDHPSLMKIYGDFQYKIRGRQTLFVISEEELTPLSQMERGDIDINKLVKNLLEALAYMENKGVSHRRINPNNIFYVGESYKLSIGTSMLMVNDGTEEVEYMAPELREILKEPEGSKMRVSFPKCDVYSFGVTVFKVHTGQLYKDETDLRTVEDILIKGLVQCSVKINPEERCTFQNLLARLPNN